MDIDTITSRRSVSPRWLLDPKPNKEQLRSLIAAACLATDHRRLRPFRFIGIENSGRTELSNLFLEAAREIHGDMTPEQEMRAREKAMNGAVLVALVACIHPDVADVPEYEQWIAVGAALQNALLAAHTIGFAAMIVSGDKVGSTMLHEGLGLSSSEHLVGFIAIGTPAKAQKPRSDVDLATVFSQWPPDKGLVA